MRLTPPSPGYSFTDYQTAHPTSPPPGDMMDAEFERGYAFDEDVATSLDLIQRDDGQLRNSIVHFETLDATLQAILDNAKGLPAVDNIAALRALDTAAVNAGDFVLVRGATMSSDGGGGVFLWSALSAAADDGVSVIKPTAVPGLGRWLLFLEAGVSSTPSTPSTPSTGGMSGVSSIVSLRAASTAGLQAGDPIMVRGYYSDADGGGGLFLWNPASTAADDGGTIIKPSAVGAGSGRWVRFIPAGTALDIRWYGAKCDGTTDDTLAVQACIGAIAAAGGGAMCIPKGVCVVTDCITLPANIYVFGYGAASVVKLVLPDGTPVIPVFDTASTSSYVTLENFAIDHNAGALAMNVCYGGDPGGGCAVLMQGDHFRLRGLNVSNGFNNGIFAVRYRIAFNATVADRIAASNSTGLTYRGSPQWWAISDIKTANCGCGNSTWAGKLGKNGAGVDIGSASAGVFTNAVDWKSYNGFIIPDVGAGGQNIVSNLSAFYTQIDAANPANGSGTAFYIGDGNSQISNLAAIQPAGHGYWLGGYGQYNQLSNCYVRYCGGHGFVCKGGVWKLNNCEVYNASQSTITNIADFPARGSAPYWDAFAAIGNQNLRLTLVGCAAHGISHAWGYSDTKQTLTKTSVTTTSGLPTITMSSTSPVQAGMSISGAGIPAGTTVVSVDSTTQITMSANATANGSVTLTFTPLWEMRAYGGSFEGLLGGMPTSAFSTERALGGVLRGFSSLTAPVGSQLLFATEFGTQVKIDDQGVASANFIFLKGSPSGSAVQIGAYPAGADANVDLTLSAFGPTGAVRPNRLIPTYFETGNIYTPAAVLAVRTTGGNTAFQVADTGVAPTNYVIAKGTTTGVAQLLGWGTGTDSDLQLIAQGGGRVRAPTVPGTLSGTEVATMAAVRALSRKEYKLFVGATREAANKVLACFDASVAGSLVLGSAGSAAPSGWTILCKTAPAATWAIKLQKGGVDTGLSISISAANAVTWTNPGGTVSLAAGDELCWVQTSTPSNTTTGDEVNARLTMIQT